MDASFSLGKGKKYSVNDSFKIEAAKKICTFLFYSSLIVLIANYLFSNHFMQVVNVVASIFLGLAMVLSIKNWYLPALYILNLTLLGAMCSVGYYYKVYDISMIFFLPLLMCNRIILKDTKHFWLLTSLVIFAALSYVLFISLDVGNNRYIVDGILILIAILGILVILNYSELHGDNVSNDEKNSLQFLQKIIDLNPHLIYAKSKEGKFTFVNQQFADEIGLPKDEIIGKSDFEIGIPKEVALKYVSSDIQVMDNGVRVENYLDIKSKSGKDKYVHSIKSPFKNDNGETIGVLGISMDRSAEKQYEDELFTSKLLYQTLFDNLNDAVIIYDYEHEKVCSYNKAATETFNATKNKDLGKYSRFDLFPEEIKGISVQEQLNLHKQMILDAKPIKGSAVMKRITGELFACKISVFPTPEPNAEAIIVIKDVSIENKAKRSILKAKDYFMQIYENSPVAISLTDIDTMKVTDINSTHQKVFGYAIEGIKDLSIVHLRPNINLSKEEELINQLKTKKKTKSVVENIYKTSAGENINVRTSQSIITRDGKDYLLQFMEDITEEKQHDEQHKFLIENAFDGIAISDADKEQLIYCNSNLRNYFGFDEAFDISKFNILDYSPSIQDNGLSSSDFRDQISREVKEKGKKEFCWKFKLPCGEIKYSDITLLKRTVGKDNLIYSIYKDTTSELSVQNALRESEKRFRLIFDNAFDGLYFYNYKTQELELANKRLFELFETSPDRILIDKPHLKPDIQPDGQATIEKIQQSFQETLEKGKSRAERIFEKSDGTTVHLEISTFLLSPPDDDIIVSIYKDISDQKRAEDALVVTATQEEKLGALGRELSSYTLFTTQKNRLLQELSDDLKIMVALDANESKIMADKIRRKIANNLDEKENWISFKVQFERVHPGFFNVLETTYAELTTNDLKHCAYIKMGLSNAEIADILFVGKKAIEMSHYRLKKKLGLPKNISLKQAMLDLGAKSILA